MIVTERRTESPSLRGYAARLLARAAARLDNANHSNGHREVKPIYWLVDFGDDSSPLECIQVTRGIFNRNGIPCEAPDIVRDIEPGNIIHGAFTTRRHIQTYLSTEGQRPSIFGVVVDPGVGSKRRGVVVTTREGCTLIGPDNGVLWPSLQILTPTSAYQIREGVFAASSRTFHGRDQFAPLVAELALGKHPTELPQLEQISPADLVKMEFAAGQVVDNGLGNLKLWIRGIPLDSKGERAKSAVLRTRRWFGDIALPWPRSIEITVAKTFSDVEVGQWLVYEGSSDRGPIDNAGLVEIAVREGFGQDSAAARLRAKPGDILQLSWRF